jgi:hypothetical protein
MPETIAQVDKFFHLRLESPALGGMVNSFPTAWPEIFSEPCYIPSKNPEYFPIHRMRSGTAFAFGFPLMRVINQQR